jgi:hypothetical protein
MPHCIPTQHKNNLKRSQVLHIGIIGKMAYGIRGTGKIPHFTHPWLKGVKVLIHLKDFALKRELYNTLAIQSCLEKCLPGSRYRQSEITATIIPGNHQC